MGKLQPLMEQMGFCERLFGRHTRGPQPADLVDVTHPFLNNIQYLSESPDVKFNDKEESHPLQFSSASHAGEQS